MKSSSFSAISSAVLALLTASSLMCIAAGTDALPAAVEPLSSLRGTLTKSAPTAPDGISGSHHQHRSLQASSCPFASCSSHEDCGAEELCNQYSQCQPGITKTITVNGKKTKYRLFTEDLSDYCFCGSTDNNEACKSGRCAHISDDAQDVCLPKLDNNLPCEQDSDCSNGHCDPNGKCGKRNGRSCNGSHDCQSGHCKTCGILDSNPKCRKLTEDGWSGCD